MQQLEKEEEEEDLAEPPLVSLLLAPSLSPADADADAAAADDDDDDDDDALTSGCVAPAVAAADRAVSSSSSLA